MIEPEDKVAAVVDAAGGKLVSRVRLQKAVYLLDQLGLDSGFGYEYHHYGPYSRDLDVATGDAKALGVLDEKIQHRAGDGASYSVFKLAAPGASNEDALGTIRRRSTITDSVYDLLWIVDDPGAATLATISRMIDENAIRGAIYGHQGPIG